MPMDLTARTLALTAKPDVDALRNGWVTPMSSGSPQPAPDPITGDWSTGLQWALDQAGPMVLPPRTTPYCTSVPLEFSKAGRKKEIWLQGGATLKALASFTAGTPTEAASNLGAILWARTPDPSAPTSYTDGGSIWGSGTIDCNGVALRGINLRYARNHTIDGLTLKGVKLVAVHVGSNPDVGAISIDNKVVNVTAFTPEWANGNGLIGMNDPNSVGILIDNGTDNRVQSCQPIGFRTGAQLATATLAIDLHPWTTARYGPMTRGIDLVGVCDLFACYTDTPTTLGVLSGEKAYGVYLRTAANASILNGIRGYLADTADSLTAGVDNDAYFIYCESNAANAKIFGARSGSANAAKRWIDTLGSSNNSGLLNVIEVVGAYSDDGRFITNSLGWTLRRNLNANFYPSRTDRATASGAVALSISSSSRQRFTAALTGTVTVSLPTPATGVFMEYVLIRAASATGAYSIVIVDQNAATIATLSAAGTRVTVGCDGSGNWAQLASGAA